MRALLALERNENVTDKRHDGCVCTVHKLRKLQILSFGFKYAMTYVVIVSEVVQL